MQLRLVHTLSLTLLAFAAAAVLALGGLTAWNLRLGFGEYIAMRDVQHFERFVRAIEAAIQVDGLPALLEGRLSLPAVLEEMRPGPSGPAGRHLSQDARPAAGSEPFPERVQIVAMNGKVLMGEAAGPRAIATAEAGPIVERQVRFEGEVVAIASLRPAAMLPEGREARFLHDQYRVLAASAAGLMLLALLIAAALARRWTRPLAAVQEATQRLARGELAVRLPAGPKLADRSDEMGDLMRNVNHMADGLQRLEGARRRWLADISHELRTPLTVLRGDTEALLDGIRPLALEAIKVLHEEIMRLGKLVDDLHLLATSDLQALPCHFAPTDVNGLLEGVARRFGGRAAAAGLSLEWQCDSGVPPGSAHWDAGRIEQLLANLLENSLRYTDAPGVVRLGVERIGATLRLRVEDSAPGVPMAQWSQLFEPLYRGDAARARQYGGSGLGLAICQAIARAHGGHLIAQASPLGGLCITAELPEVAQISTQPGSARPT